MFVPIRRLVKVGSSEGFTVPRPVLRQLGASRGDHFLLTVKDGALVFRLVDLDEMVREQAKRHSDAPLATQPR